MKLYNAIFPDLVAKGDWGYVNLNTLAKAMRNLLSLKEDENPCLSPVVFKKWVGFLHELNNINYSYGGFLEDRSILWKNHYQKPGEAIHYGLDFSVPLNTNVYMPVDGTLVDLMIDKDQDGGWGGRLIFNFDEYFLLFGHIVINDTSKDFYKAGDIIGTIAPATTNGGWWPHLHFQLMNKFDKDIDGYGSSESVAEKGILDPCILENLLK